MTDEEINRITFEQWGPVIDVHPAAYRAYARAIIAAYQAKLLAVAGMPEPDTHCWDDDMQTDCWSYSKDQMREYAAAAALNARRDVLEEVESIIDEPPLNGNTIAQARVVMAIEALKEKV